MKLGYLTKSSFFDDFGFVSKVKMANKVKPKDDLFQVAYPYSNVNGTFLVLASNDLNRDSFQSVSFLFVLYHDCLMLVGYPEMLVVEELYKKL